ncbi:Sodium/potassium-transporting ATPase subunit alpha-B [Orchesella cincta]|uniref:Sodium/potassium-transporting ATPase subunit alpha n=1 Tax=Orchesella cincta TaxID=48709 RepID=A0A1D2N1E7_ORCCI|nr:Sodium/potassium-transporting ATPase subunit alpha-B [Orchesella cincta]
MPGKKNGSYAMDNPGFENDLQMVEIQSPKSPDTGNQPKGFECDDHRVPLETLLKRYGANVTKGLKEDQVQANRAKYGKNILIPPKKPSLIFVLFKEIWGGLNLLLWACGFLCIISYLFQFLITPDNIAPDNLILFVSIVLVVHVSGTCSFYQDFKSDRIMESFKDMVPRQSIVLRNGKKMEMEVAEIVVGDIVEVKFGDLIPADIRILESHDFKVDNSSLTGESEPQKRSPECTHDEPMETKNLAFFSTNALEGVATGLVIRVGSNTLMGQLASLASNVDGGNSPLGIELNNFIKIMTIRSVVFGLSFFGVAMFLGYGLQNSVYFVIGIVVANVPEGLALTFTMTLSVAAQKMAKKNCLVKHLHAVEALGSTSVICSDKTGTLTQNKMSVAHLWFNNEIAEADTSEFQTGQNFDSDDPGFMALANVAMLCSRANFSPGQETVPVLKRLVQGDASETAILKCMELQFGNVAKYRQKYPKLCEIPFNSTNKFQVSIHDMRNPADPRYLLVMKGAPERIINLCSKILINNKEYDLDQQWREEFNKVYHTLGTYGERVLGFCDCKLPLDRYPVGVEFSEDDPNFLDVGFRFVGLMSMIDPPRAAVPDAVARCRSAGIKVVMVTGDHPVTATAIARAVGIITPGNETIEEMAISQGVSVEDINPAEVKAAVVSGAELKLLSPEELRNVIHNHEEIVFARTSPEQKYIIVDAFQDLGYVVASTGDGVNDSPALKKADIGIAMGITGSEVSKETADMILMDDNFATIVTGVEEGRLIFDNLKKLLAYQLADNIAEMYSVMFFIILGVPLQMGTIAMLLSVCGTDVWPAIALSYETAESDIMKLKPRNPREDKMVTPQLLSYCYGQNSFMEVFSGYFVSAVCYMLNGWMPWDLLWNQSAWNSKAINDMKDSYNQEWTYFARQELTFTAQTTFFISIVLTQIANVYCCKTRRMSLYQKGIGNMRMNIGVCFAILLACFLIYTPYLNFYVNFRYVRPEMWLAPIPFMLYMHFYDEIRKLIIRVSKGWLHTEFNY